MTLPPIARRYLVTYALAGMGALIGAVVGAALTLVSYALVGILQIPKAEYFIHNAISCSILGAVIAPVGAWLALRKVPLWRAVAEPAVVGVVAVAATIGSGGLPALLLPAGAVLASVWRLNRAYNSVGTSRAALMSQRSVHLKSPDSGTTR